MDPIIIIGSGHAGLNVAREIRANDPHVPITLLSKESICAYYKPNLSKALSMGKSVEQLIMKSEDTLATELKAALISNVSVSAILPEDKTITYEDEAGSSQTIPYAKLVLATGANPIRLPIEQLSEEPFLSVNNLEDYRMFRQAIEGKKRVLIIGAGFVGCELASDLNTQGFKVDVVDKGQWPLQRVIPEIMGRAIKNAMTENGTQWHFGCTLMSIENRNGRIFAKLSSGQTIETDLIVTAIGLTPNTQQAKAAGLTSDRGIIIDNFCRTSDEHIFALGDCAQYQNGLLPFIAPATQAAKAIGKTLTGEPTAMNLPPLAVAVKIAVCPTVICPPEDGKGIWEVQGSEGNLEAHFINEHGQLKGFALTGNAVARKAALTKAIQASTNIDTLLPQDSSLHAKAAML